MLTLVIIIISLFFLSSSIDVLLNNDRCVLGVCGPPHLPPGSILAEEKNWFIENETVKFSCQDYGIVGQNQTCRHGTWQGEQARCGKVIVSPLIRFEAFKCDSLSEPLVTQVVNQTISSRPSSYSFQVDRVPKTLKLHSNGSNCYRWRLKLEKPVEIAILSVEASTDRMNHMLVKPNVTAQIAHRTCRVRDFYHHFVGGRDFFVIDYHCYLYSNLTDLNTVDLDTLETDTIELKVEWPTEREIRLESLLFAETVKIDAKTEKHTPNCGEPERRLGVIKRLRSNYSDFSCDSSMVDVTPNSSLFSSRGWYHQTCNANGEWTGTYPQCVPKQTCSKEEITAEIDDSVKIEAVSKVYYTNDTHWEAIDYTWVSYVCSHPRAFFLSDSYRLCLNRTWTNTVPKCTQDLKAVDLKTLETGKFTRNSSMVDITLNSTRLSHGGEFRQTCSKKQITADLNDSVKIKAVGNVYYTNNTHWEAINYTWVSYVCSHPDASFHNETNRVCLNGTWTNTLPKCTRDLNLLSSTNLSMTLIITIVILVIVSVITIIVVLVYLGLRYTKRQPKEKLQTAKEEIAQSVLNETVPGDEYSDPQACEEQLGGDFVGQDSLNIHGAMPAEKGGVENVSMTEGVSPRDMNHTNMSLKIKLGLTNTN